jgi:hypothetical protein
VSLLLSALTIQSEGGILAEDEKQTQKLEKQRIERNVFGELMPQDGGVANYRFP